MSQLIDIIPSMEDDLPETLYDPEYQGNMYLIEAAMRETGARPGKSLQNRSPYDTKLLELINSVPIL